MGASDWFQLEIRLSLKTELFGPFLSMGFNCLKATEPQQGDSLLFTIKPQGIPSTHLINLKGMTG